MSNEGSTYEARILELEREAIRLHQRLRPLEHGRLRAVEEGLAMFTGSRPCITTSTGTIYDGRLDPFPGATLRFVGHVTGNDYGTATADGSGFFEHAMEISSADKVTVGTGMQVDIYTDHPTDGGRLDGTVLIENGIFNPCVVNGPSDIRSSGRRGVEAATGYVYPEDDSHLSPAIFPISKTLNTDDSGNAGTFTSTWTGPGSPWWTGTHTSTYQLLWNQGPDNFTLGIAGTLRGTATTWTDPDPATSTKFSVTFTNVITAGRTVTFREP